MHTSKQTCEAPRGVTTDPPPFFTEVVDIPHRAAEPERPQRRLSDRLQEAARRRQDSEEETSHQWALVSAVAGSPLRSDLSRSCVSVRVTGDEEVGLPGRSLAPRPLSFGRKT